MAAERMDIYMDQMSALRTVKGETTAKKPNHLASVCFKNPNRESTGSTGKETQDQSTTETQNSITEDVRNVYIDVESSDDEYVFTLRETVMM